MIEKKQIDKLLKLVVGIVILFAIFSQIYSLIEIKAFWLDEWFILYNIKYKSYSELFGNLFYIQQFPRIYLILIKFLADISNYNYLILRLLPTLMQIINIILIVYLIRKIVFPDNEYKGFLFVLFFLSFQTTWFYFTQLKQYTMEMFFSLLSLYYFYYISKNYDKIKVKSVAYLLILLGIFTGSFFSYTFPIVILPLMISLFFTVVYDFSNKQFQLKPILPILIFLISLIINYFTDLQYVLNSKEQYGNFDEYIMNYDSLSSIIKSSYNIIRIFAYNFTYTPQNYNIIFASFLHLTKIVIIFLTIIGLIIKIKEQFDKIRTDKLKYFKTFSFRANPDISVYLLILFLATFFLYFLRMLPTGQPRINYFSYLFTTYFLIVGLSWIVVKHKYIRYFMISIVLFATMFQITRNYIREIENKNLIFDQNIYENVGNAIIKAQNDKLPVVVMNNEFYPSSIMEKQENLLIKAHHLYKLNKPIELYVVDSLKLSNLQDSLKMVRYLKLNKHDYKILNDN